MGIGANAPKTPWNCVVLESIEKRKSNEDSLQCHWPSIIPIKLFSWILPVFILWIKLSWFPPAHLTHRFIIFPVPWSCRACKTWHMYLYTRRCASCLGLSIWAEFSIMLQTLSQITKETNSRHSTSDRLIAFYLHSTFLRLVMWPSCYWWENCSQGRLRVSVKVAQLLHDSFEEEPAIDALTGITPIASWASRLRPCWSLPGLL